MTYPLAIRYRTNRLHRRRIDSSTHTYTKSLSRFFSPGAFVSDLASIARTHTDGDDEEVGIMSETWPSAVPNRLGAVSSSTQGTEVTVSSCPCIPLSPVTSSVISHIARREHKLTRPVGYSLTYTSIIHHVLRLFRLPRLPSSLSITSYHPLFQSPLPPARDIQSSIRSTPHHPSPPALHQTTFRIRPDSFPRDRQF